MKATRSPGESRRPQITRKAVEALAGPTTDLQWGEIQWEVDDAELHGTDFTLEDAVATVRADNESRRRAPAVPRTNELLELRAQALGAWARGQIGNTLAVRRWRHRHGLRDLTDLHGEITTTISASAGMRVGGFLHWIEVTDVGEAAWANDVPQRSPWDDLARAASTIAAEWRMHPADASAVIACDVVRPVEPLMARVERRSRFGAFATPAGPLSRIVLEIDPRVPSAVVRQAYEGLCAEQFPDCSQRSMGRRLLALSAFLAARDTEEQPKDYQADWMAQSGEPRTANFARDVRRALQLLFS